MKNIKFTPGDTSYSRKTSSESPFSKRNLTAYSFDKISISRLLTVKKRYYKMFFVNEKESYQSRNQNSAVKEKAQKDKKYLFENDLRGNPAQIRFSIKKLLKHVISRFDADPRSLFTEVKIINDICAEENFEIPVIEAFFGIKNWHEFITLLTSISESESPFKFELMIAAMIQYADLCGED